MVNQIQSINTQSSVIAPTKMEYSSKVGFKASPEAADSFAPQEKKKLTKLEIFLGATTCAFAGVSGVVLKKSSALNTQLGKFIEKLGGEAPAKAMDGLTKLFDFASKDAMTGLHNKMSLKSSIKKYYAQAVAQGKSLSAAFLDMDNFKGINEVFGHDTGDTVLKRISANIQAVTQKHGINGYRYGGEEFVLLAPEKNAKALQAVVQDIAEAIKSDPEIQGLLPSFREKANLDIVFLTNIRTQLNSIFTRLKSKRGTQENEDLAHEIVKLVKDYTAKYNASENKPIQAMVNTHSTGNKQLQDVITRISSATMGNLGKVLDINAGITEELTLGNELNKIFTNSGDMLHDLQKWIHHVDKHGKFTVSGGVADLSSSNQINSGDALINIADDALKAAKESGKNNIRLASE